MAVPSDWDMMLALWQTGARLVRQLKLGSRGSGSADGAGAIERNGTQLRPPTDLLMNEESVPDVHKRVATMNRIFVSRDGHVHTVWRLGRCRVAVGQSPDCRLSLLFTTIARMH